jgi:hypothetical protein
MASIGKAFRIDLRAAVLADATIFGLIGERYFAVLAKHDVQTPYMVVSTVSNLQPHTHQGSTGIEEPRMQFSVFADNPTTCQEIRDALKDLLDGLKVTWSASKVGSCFYDSEIDTYEPSSDIHQIDIDFHFMVSGL